jgi:hypothetical protein
MRLYFFDNYTVLNHRNVRLAYGIPKSAGYFKPDPGKSLGWGPKVIKGSPLAPYVMYYDTWSDIHGVWDHKPFAAVSDDCINWEPLKEPLLFKDEDDTVRPFERGIIGDILTSAYDKSSETETYRLISHSNFAEKQWRQTLFYSGDGICFSKRDLDWNGTPTEPCGGCFYHKEKNIWHMTVRRIMGERGCGIKETKDFVHFSEWRPAVTVDSEDSLSDELYCMTASPLENIYIGLVGMYKTPYDDAAAGKFIKGKMECQLAYSYDGSYFRRSLRRPFITPGDPSDSAYGMFVPMDLTDCGDCVIITGLPTPTEHGHENLGAGFYRLPKDHFCGLESTGGDAYFQTRPMAYFGGNITINISVPCGEAVCRLKNQENKTIPGFDFQDCVPFSGDELRWKPQWKGHELSETGRGKIIIVELRWYNGIVWTIDCDAKLLPSGGEMKKYINETL